LKFLVPFVPGAYEVINVRWMDDDEEIDANPLHCHADTGLALFKFGQSEILL
jgi:hypothetical protein